MSQYSYWKQLIASSRNWKVIKNGLRHIERMEKATVAPAAQR